MAGQVFSNGTKCPHCGHRCTSIRADQVTDLYREVVYQCRNCDFMFVASITPVRTVFPSKTPNPTVVIPGDQRSRSAHQVA